jgi:hypothetical protein
MQALQSNVVLWLFILRPVPHQCRGQRVQQHQQQSGMAGTVA